MCTALPVLVVALSLLLCMPTAQAQDEEFHEELVVRPLAGDHVNTYFQFTTRWHYGSRKNLYHTQLTPRVIAEILQTYDVKELHIGLTQGLWRYESWGYPIVEATGGAELYAWFSAPHLTNDQVDAQWMQLANVFSGVLCVSLNFVDNTNSYAPQHIFRPQFMQSYNESNKQFVRYATLPREIVCTENLTPWKKLLPCGSASGLATLLNSGYVHNTKYHSLGVKVRTLCDDNDDNCIVELTQTANLVYDLKLLEQSNTDFSLRRLFGMGLSGYCELASSSMIYVQRNELGANYQLVPQAQHNVSSTRGGYTLEYGVYDMQKQFVGPTSRLFNIAWVRHKDISSSSSSSSSSLKQLTSLPPIYAHRYLLGNGQKRGRIAIELTNTHHEPLPVVLMELVPWYVYAYLHTLRIRGKPARLQDYDQALPFRLLHYAPGKQRELPTHLEIGFMLPARSSALVTLEVDFLLLKWLEYPPDANHGHYIGAAVISTQLPMGRKYAALPLEGHLFRDSFNASSQSYILTLRTEALIVSLPTPDFSMPYNVICLACTVVALAFGPIHSVATKLIIVERQTTIPRNLLRKLFHKLTRRARKATGSPAAATSAVADEKGKEQEQQQKQQQQKSCDKQTQM